jgi:ParB family chromosome partitioning protein
MAMPPKRLALGRGLSALIPEGTPPADGREAAIEIDLDLLRPNPFQPRLHVDVEALSELSESVRAHGVLQPILVRRAGDMYEIVAGERRWRAAQQAGLLKVPVVVRDVPDDRLLETALIENLQREDLNPIDEALAYQRLLDEFHLTQEAIAAAVGKDRSSVANHLRLLRLPDDVRREVSAGNLSMGHARALVAVEDDGLLRRAAAEVVTRKLSVRETEALVKKLTAPPAAPPSGRDVHTRQAEDALKFSLGTRVRIVRKGKGGRIEIDFVSEEELQRLYEQLTAK